MRLGKCSLFLTNQKRLYPTRHSLLTGFVLLQAFLDPSVSSSAEKKSSASAGGTGKSLSPAHFTEHYKSTILGAGFEFCLEIFCEHQEADRKILAALLEGEAEDRRLESARRERAVADAAWMKRVIEEQLQLEREREAEFEILHR